MAGLVSVGFSASGLLFSCFFGSGFLAAGLTGYVLTGPGLAEVAGLVEVAGLAEVKVRPLALGRVGCGPLALRMPHERPEKPRTLPSGRFTGGAPYREWVPQDSVAGCGASGLGGG